MISYFLPALGLTLAFLLISWLLSQGIYQIADNKQWVNYRTFSIYLMLSWILYITVLFPFIKVIALSTTEFCFIYTILAIIVSIIQRTRKKEISFSKFSKIFGSLLFLMAFLEWLLDPDGLMVMLNLVILSILWLLIFGYGIGGDLASNFSIPKKPSSKSVVRENRENVTLDDKQTDGTKLKKDSDKKKIYSRYFLIYGLPGIGVIALYVIIQLILTNVPEFTKIVNISYWLIFVLIGVGLIGLYVNQKVKMQQSTLFKIFASVVTVGIVTAVVFSVHTKIMNDRYMRAFDDFNTDYEVLKARFDFAEAYGDEPEDDYDGDGSTNGSEDSSHILKNMDKNLEVMLRNNTGTYNIRKAVKHYDDMDDEFSQW